MLTKDGEKISIKNKTLMLSIFLMFFIMIGAASAGELNETCDIMALDESQDVTGEAHESVVEDSSESIKTSLETNDTTIIKGEELSVRLADDKGGGISNKNITVEMNNVSTPITTNNDGVAKLKIDVDSGIYAVKFTFSNEGYTQCNLTKEIMVISTQTPTIKASDYTAYVGIKNTFVVKLTIDGLLLEGRSIRFKIDGKTYNATTDSKGKASLDLDLAKGTYDITYEYDGEYNIKSASGTSKIYVKKGVSVKITKYSSKIYRNKQSGKFKVKVVDARGDAVSSKKVIFKINGKKYTKKTNENGIASISIKLKTGSYKIKVKCDKTSVYKKASKTFSIKVKPKYCRNNGFWLLSTDMKSVNFDKYQKLGTKHIFLNAKAIERFGKTYVESWIKTAKSHGIKVHLWMQVFYKSDKWQNPISGGKVNYNLLKAKVKEAKKLAKIKGVGGIHFDYVRFPGNAYKYNGAVKAVNYFVKHATKAIHKVGKKIIVSAAVMPEPSSMKKYYAQDIPTMGKYLDAILPMVYKGNYNAGTNWIKQVTKTFASQSKKAKIWTGLQTYKSDSKLTKLSASELMGDADAAALGGARGVIMFRYGLLNAFNFNEV